MPSLGSRLTVALVLAATSALAAADITLYERDKFGGRRFGTAQSVSDLANVEFNDRAKSAVVNGGSWQLCTDAYFRGRCVTLSSGEYPSLRKLGIAGAVSSVREVGWASGMPAAGAPRAGHAVASRIVLYGQPNLGGRGRPLDTAADDLQAVGFNDSARSAIVYGGNWQVCSDAHFKGDCEVLRPGQWNSLGTVSGRVSSARPVAADGNAPVVNGWGSGSRAVLYEGRDLSGRSFVIDNEVMSNLDRTGFNDRARSLRVEGGYWLFCSDAQFQGECLTFAPGDYPTLPRELEARISSGRRISTAYPYTQGPAWRR